jgi:hypothetical protein
MSSGLYAQDRTGYYKLKCHIDIHYTEGDYCGGCGDHTFEYTFQFANTNTAKNFCLPNGNYYTTVDDSVVYPYTNKVLQVKNEVWGSFDRHFLGKCGSYNNANTYPVINYNGECIVQNISAIIPSSGQLSDHVSNENMATVTVTPIIKLFPDDAMDLLFPSDDNINIRASVGFYSSVYNWKFSVDNGVTWYSFPNQYIGKDSINLNAATLLNSVGLNVDDYVQKNIQVKTSACNNSTQSEILTYRITKSPPHISTIVSTPSTCFDSDNGIIKLSFGRALLPQEKIQFKIVNANNPSLFYDPSTDTLDVNNVCNIPQNLPPGKYILTYNARTFTPSGDESWSNLITTDTITITAPTAVAFTNSKTDVWCYDGSDGVIVLSATGGVGNYQYMIKKQGSPDLLWYNFSAATTHSITGLSKGSYEILTRDGNGCFAKNGSLRNNNLNTCDY